MQKSSFLVSAVESKSSFVVTSNNPPVTYLKHLCCTCVGEGNIFPCCNFFLFLLALRIVGFLSSGLIKKVTSPDFLFLVEGVSFFVLCFVSCVFVEDFWWHFHLFVFVCVFFFFGFPFGGIL